MKCAPLIADEACQWIAGTGWKEHLSSRVHARALLHEQTSRERVSAVSRAMNAAMQEDTEIVYAPLNNHLAGSSSSKITPNMHVPTVNEEAMWYAFEMGDVNFDAGSAPDLALERQRFERKMDEFGIWNAERVGGVLGAEIDEFMLNEQEDEVLAETLRNVRKCILHYIICMTHS
jgi:hypothetical protein